MVEWWESEAVWQKIAELPAPVFEDLLTAARARARGKQRVKPDGPPIVAGDQVQEVHVSQLALTLQATYALNAGHTTTGKQAGHVKAWHAKRRSGNKECRTLDLSMGFTAFLFDTVQCACYWCGKRRRAQLEHLTPLSRGGTHDIENLQASCRSCNAKKHDKTPEEFMEWMESRGEEAALDDSAKRYYLEQMVPLGTCATMKPGTE
jgi:hypothetical protein